MKLLLFDIDGTMLLAGGAGMRAMREAGRAVFGDRFTFDGVIAAGGLDHALVAEAAANSGVGLDDALHERFRETYLPLLEAELAAAAADVRPLPGVEALIGRLRTDERVRLGLLSGNYAGAADLKLRAGGMDPGWFAIHSFCDHGPDRPSLVRYAMDVHGNGLRPDDVIVIGDTPRDVHCAKAHRCIAFGVATGRYSVLPQLHEAGADVVVETLAEAEALHALIHS